MAWYDAAELFARVVQGIFLTVFWGLGEVPAGILTKPLVGEVAWCLYWDHVGKTQQKGMAGLVSDRDCAMAVLGAGCL